MDRYKLPERLPFSKKRLPVRVMISYILDYVIIVVLIIGFTALGAVEPFHQHFSLRNYTLQYPYAVKERVPIVLLAFVAVACPAMIIIVYTMMIDGFFSHHKPDGSAGGNRRLLNGRYRLKDRLWELNCGILGLGLSVATAYTITGALKNATGKPRPDLIDRCQPKAGSQDPLPFGLSNSTICTQTDHAILQDGFRSFPSGHSSTAFSGLFYLSLYLSGKMHLLDNRGEVWKTFIVLVPTIGAALIADTRIMDARHHPFDVISGSLLGIATAWASYRQYFGPVMESWRKGRAYAIRTWGRAPIHPNDRQEPVYDNSVEPLRALDNHPTSVPADEEAIPSSYQHPGANIVPQENVFREQIHRSQRQRGGADGRGGGGRERTYDQGDADLATAYNPSHPYDTSGSRRRNYRPHDGYASSSSEDRDWDQHDPYDNGFELQQQYTLSDPQGTRGNFMADEDTAYSSGGGASRPDNNYGAPERGGSVPAQVHQQPDSSAGPLHVPIPAPEIDLAATAAPPAPSSQLLQQHAARKPVDLVETYAAGVK